MRFEWDEEKANENKKKHKISFETARLVFSDPYRREFYDIEHSDEQETRWITIGRAGKVLFVVYTERECGDVIRLISARLATPTERKEYYGNGDW